MTLSVNVEVHDLVRRKARTLYWPPRALSAGHALRRHRQGHQGVAEDGQGHRHRPSRTRSATCRPRPTPTASDARPRSIRRPRTTTPRPATARRRTRWAGSTSTETVPQTLKRAGCTGSRSTTWNRRPQRSTAQTLMPRRAENSILPRVPSTATRSRTRPSAAVRRGRGSCRSPRSDEGGRSLSRSRRAPSTRSPSGVRRSGRLAQERDRRRPLGELRLPGRSADQDSARPPVVRGRHRRSLSPAPGGRPAAGERCATVDPMRRTRPRAPRAR